MRIGVLVAGLAMALTPTMADAHNCKCRNRGVMFELGQTACLRVDGGSYLARCEMKLNVSSWTRIQEGCPVTERSLKRPALTTWSPRQVM
ncbi:hypothetical protein P9A16_19905 [Shinella sp. 838]|jgi:hypothetical protein|uniref:hypothetical protein n=1 Tax=unclassified Shinella TaxID=2643062 RepID=UPI0003C56B0E|nr:MULTISPECIES: hypothetical protein [unclassified Shinella]EYR84385.1 hypothetical protein SHLA_61c000430 [Shinella sp. DD12]MCA0344347.1 hypothetical protein [Pseudomonadota bacterium]MDG4673402.1 hypothetical protein [Shinella sp. 838]